MTREERRAIARRKGVRRWYLFVTVPHPGEVADLVPAAPYLSIRMGNRRLTRLTNAFSKSLFHHAAMVAFYFLHYNFCRVHNSLRVTPPMAAGLDTTVRDCEWIVGLIDARTPKPNRPKTYRQTSVSNRDTTHRPGDEGGLYDGVPIVRETQFTGDPGPG